MRLEHETKTHPRLLRKSALGEKESTSKSKKAVRRDKAPGTRFVGATHLDEPQKAAISRALKKQRIGDEMGRQIFVCAVEYQLTVFASQLERRTEPDPQVLEQQAQLARSLLDIAAKAQELSPAIGVLAESSRERLTLSLTAQDTLRRTYDDRYLYELGAEVDRLQRAAIAAAEAAQAEPVRENPAPSRDFVAKLAKVYAECFEATPTAEPGAGFSFVLESLGEVTGLVIGHEPEFLAGILP